MIHLPPIPAWQALHPLVVHFPIALLLVAPVFILGGAILSGEKARYALLAALLLMLMGTAGIFVARASGEAASKAAVRNPEINAVLENHEEMAETSSILFSVLTVIFAGIAVGPALLKWRENRVLTTALPLCFLVLYSAGAVLLINTAHNGGRLVHELGVRSGLQAAQAAATAAPASTADND